MNDQNQTTSTPSEPTLCKMGCGFFVSFESLLLALVGSFVFWRSSSFRLLNWLFCFWSRMMGGVGLVDHELWMHLFSTWLNGLINRLQQWSLLNVGLAFSRVTRPPRDFEVTSLFFSLTLHCPLSILSPPSLLWLHREVMPPETAVPNVGMILERIRKEASLWPQPLRFPRRQQLLNLLNRPPPPKMAVYHHLPMWKWTM